MIKLLKVGIGKFIIFIRMMILTYYFITKLSLFKIYTVTAIDQSPDRNCNHVISDNCNSAIKDRCQLRKIIVKYANPVKEMRDKKGTFIRTVGHTQGTTDWRQHIYES